MKNRSEPRAALSSTSRAVVAVHAAVSTFATARYADLGAVRAGTRRRTTEGTTREVAR